MKSIVVDSVLGITLFIVLFFIIIGILRHFAGLIGDFFFRLFKRIIKPVSKN